jgi:hypothetical protein
MFHRFAESTESFSFWWLMQRTPRLRSSVRLLFGVVGVPLIAFQCGVRERPQVNDHISLPAFHFLLHALFDILFVE